MAKTNAAPARKQAAPVAVQPSFEIVSITDWPEYRAAHPELVFTGNFDPQGRATFAAQSPETFSESRPLWAEEERK